MTLWEQPPALKEEIYEKAASLQEGVCFGDMSLWGKQVFHFEKDSMDQGMELGSQGRKFEEVMFFCL